MQVGVTIGFIGVPWTDGMRTRLDTDGIDVIETDMTNCLNYPTEVCLVTTDPCVGYHGAVEHRAPWSARGGAEGRRGQVGPVRGRCGEGGGEIRPTPQRGVGMAISAPEARTLTDLELMAYLFRVVDSCRHRVQIFQRRS